MLKAIVFNPKNDRFSIYPLIPRKKETAMIFHVEQLFNGEAKLGTETNSVYHQYKSITSLIRYGLSHLTSGEYRISEYRDSCNPGQNGFYSGNPVKQYLWKASQGQSGLVKTKP